MKEYLNIEIWKYFLKDSYVQDIGFWHDTIDMFKRIRCRMKAHPCGPVWYNTGFEPDMHCKNCGDEL